MLAYRWLASLPLVGWYISCLASILSVNQRKLGRSEYDGLAKIQSVDWYTVGCSWQVNNQSVGQDSVCQLAQGQLTNVVKLGFRRKELGLINRGAQ